MSDKKCDLQHLYKLVQDSLLSDEIKARCVLGSDRSVLNDYEHFGNCCENSYPLIKWMGNLTTLAGAFLYAKFNQWRTETGAHPTDKERPNALYLKRLLVGIQSTTAYFKQASSGLRILRVLDGLYDNFDMNFLVIKYLIINLQIEMGFNFQSKGGGLSKLIGFPDEKSLRVTCSSDEFEKDGQNLAAAFNYVSVYHNDPDLTRNWDSDKYKDDDVWCAFEDVFRTMEFMKRVKLDIDSEGNVNFIETTSSGEEKYIPSHGVVRVFEKGNGKWNVYKSGRDIPKRFKGDFYILEKIEYLSDIITINAAVKLLYQSFDESNSVSVYFSENEGLEPEGCSFPISQEKSAADYFKRVSGYLPGSQSTAPFFRGMIIKHFRYFNILAPAIVDAIDTDFDIKIRVLKKFVQEAEDLFKEALEPAFKILESASIEVFPDDWEGKIKKLCNYISNVRIDNEYHFRTVVDWDALILRILIYEGPSEILKTILLCDRTDYQIKDREFVENTCKKIIAGLEMRYIDNVFEASDVANKQKEYYEKKIKQKIEMLKDYHPESFINKMECKVLAKSYIDTIISELTRINKGNTEKEKDKFAENSIQDTLEIFEVYKKENEYSKAYKVFLETIKAFLSFYAGIRESCPKRMSYEFERSASILSPEEIKDKQFDIENTFFKSVGKKIYELSKLFNEGSNEANAVKRALKELFDFANKPSEETKYYKAVLGRTPINSEKLAKVFKVKEEKMIFIHQGEEFSFEKAEKYGKIIDCLENIIRFLAGFEMDNHDKDNNYKERIKMVVYPQIVTFAKHHQDRDANNCLIMNHSKVFADWYKGEVQILTEFKYTINHSYYVLPNLNSIDTRWWIEPILVSCSKFDDEIRKASANKESSDAYNK
jgi:hypothetical protein